MVNATSRAYHVGSSTYTLASGNFTDSWLTLSGPQNLYRYTYSIDTTNPVSRISNVGFNTQGVVFNGNLTDGWFTGGFTGGVIGSKILRLTYANDTVAPVAKGTIVYNISSATYASNNTNGWIIDGETSPGPVARSSIIRIEYATDTGNFSQIASDLISRLWLTNSVNGTDTWIAGGAGTPAIGSSSVTRYNFSNDSVVAVGNLTRSTSHFAGR